MDILNPTKPFYVTGVGLRKYALRGSDPKNI
jgi:hypothetical protein